MKFLIKQRVFSWSDTFDIYDEYENKKYFVQAEFLSLGHRLHVYDMNGHEVGLIKEKVLTFLPEFAVDSMFNNRDAKHLTSGCTVDIFIISKGLLSPFFIR
mgnify:CR=1 FL=1